MCYSAMVYADVRAYVKMYPGLSFAQALSVILRRNRNKAIKIPTAFEANFTNPKTPDEKKAKEAIDEYRSATITGLEKEVFTQKKRLADAERKLKEKETKAALNDQRIAGNKIESALAKITELKRTDKAVKDARIFPFTYAPILIARDGKMTLNLARYHLRQPGAPESIDRKYPGLYNARRDNLEKFWRHQFGHTHALMVVSSFFENVERDGKNAVLHFTPEPKDLMLVACLYGVWNEGKPDEMLSFAAITDEPPPEIAAAGHDRCIINIKPENVKRWLTPEGRSAAELQAILDDKQRPYYENEVLAA